MSGVFRGILLGATGALGVCSQTDSLNDIPRSLLRGALTGYDRLSHKHTASPGSDSNGTSEDLKLLSQEIRDLKLASKDGGKQVIVYGGGSSTGTIIKVVIVTTTGVVVMYYLGYGFNDVMYVTKSTLSTAVKNLEEKISYVGVKLEKTKNEIFAKMSSLEESIFSTSKDLESQINSETERIRGQIDQLDDKFLRIETAQGDIKLSTGQLDSRIAQLQEKFELNGAELEKANSGIRLLVNSVVELPHIKENKGLAGDLKDFLTGYTSSWFGSNSKQTKSDDDASEKRMANIKGTGLFSLAK